MFSNAVMWRELIHRGGEAFQQEQYLLAKERFQEAFNLAEIALIKAQATPAIIEQFSEHPAEQVVQQFLIACCNLADTHNMMGHSEVAEYYYQCAWQSLQRLINSTNISPYLRQQAVIQLEKAALQFTGITSLPKKQMVETQLPSESSSKPTYH
ncbi:hypothetical protein [Spartinivicinus ruber]|uniref:hypothetical protein n=1 Tax=Spartinivicinus ruber TaxID=2683272 RepID=UPI0013D2014E|nr:hypothetical protein [Spartinivicinus ruber]